MLKAILFDMDGVLINSQKYIWASFKHLLKEDGIELSKAEINQCLGRSLKQQIQVWQKNHGMKEKDPAEFSKKAAEIEFELMKKDNLHNDNLFKLLKEAKEKGIKMAVATSSMKWRAEKILQMIGIADYFGTVITAEDVANHKPDPAVFLKAAEALETPTSQCVVFEDAAPGIEAAKKGGIKSVGLLTDFNSEELLKDADLVIKDFSEVNIDKLNELLG